MGQNQDLFRDVSPNSHFFGQFPGQGRSRSFTGFDFAAGQFPKTRTGSG